MAEHKHQQQDLRAGQQHLAYRQQDSAHQQGALDPKLQHQHQRALAEAGLEAHLAQRQHQEALVEVQALEHQRLNP